MEKFSTREANKPRASRGDSYGEFLESGWLFRFILPEEISFVGTTLLGCRVGLNKRFLALFWLS